MTKKEMFNAIAVKVADNAEMVAFINHEIELLDKKASRKTPSKTQKANEGVKATILEVLADFDAPVTVSELIATDALGEYTNQKVSALLRQLIEGGKVVKTTDKKVSRFALAE